MKRIAMFVVLAAVGVFALADMPTALAQKNDEGPEWLNEKTLGFSVLSSEEVVKAFSEPPNKPPKFPGVLVSRIYVHGPADGKLWYLEIVTHANRKLMKTPADWKSLIDASKPGDEVKLDFRPRLVSKGASDPDTWGKAEKLSLKVTTRGELARRAVAITEDQVTGDKSATLKPKSELATTDGPVSISFTLTKDNVAEFPMLTIVHSGKDWVFMDAVLLRSGKSLTKIPLGDEKPSRTVIEGGVIEVAVLKLTKPIRDAIDAALVSTEPMIFRLEGQKAPVDHTLPVEQKAALRAMLDAFVAYGGEFPAAAP